MSQTVFATVRDYNNPQTTHRLIREDGFFYVQEASPSGHAGDSLFNKSHICISDYQSEEVAYTQAMTEFITAISSMAAKVHKSLSDPEGFSLAMYDEPVEAEGGEDVYIGKGNNPTECIAWISDQIDCEGKWNFDKILEMGLPASVAALGQPEAETVWVELTIYSN